MGMLIEAAIPCYWPLYLTAGVVRSGAHGSAAGQVDAPVVPLSVVQCATCHPVTAEALDSVTLPSFLTACPAKPDDALGDGP